MTTYTTAADIGLRTCSKCGEVKSLSEYHRHKSARGGRRPDCRDCVREYRAEWAKQNPDYNRNYYAQNADRERARARRYHAENLTKRHAAWREWVSKNPSYYREQRKRDPVAARERVNRYRARKRNAFVEDVSRDRVFSRDGGSCHICRKRCRPDDWHLDHLVPLSLGGEHSYRNVAVSCPMCNQSRSNVGPAQLRLTGE